MRSFSQIQIALWFYRNASKFCLISEPIVRNALVNDGRPTPAKPLRTYFPEIVEKSTLPTPLPDNLEDQVGEIFKMRGITAIPLFESVRAGMNDGMRVDTKARNKLRFHDLIYYRFISTTAVPWVHGSHHRLRDWWPVSGGAFLESLIIQNYRLVVLLTAVGHARLQFEEIIYKWIKLTLEHIEGSRDSKMVKVWAWADKMSVTVDQLPDLATFLNAQPEVEYRRLMAIYKTRRECETIINVVFRQEATRNYLTEIIDIKNVKAKPSKKGKKASTNPVSPVLKMKPQMDCDCFNAMTTLLEVSNIDISLRILVLEQTHLSTSLWN